MIAAVVGEADRRLRVLRRRTTTKLVVLDVQLLVGMGLNLFVTVPTHPPGAGSGPYLSGALSSVLWSFASGLPLLVVDVVIGIVLLLSGIELVAHSVRLGRRAAVQLAGLGLTAIIFAGFNAASFLKYHRNISSLLKAVGFSVGVVCYVGILSLST